ncbi:NnrU family protein [Methylophaga sp. OBS4]|uniref:NnrU family protein n=1 Tax=Methylophaga sp. OBS4 TaxID=2991935 RepID=UPI0022515715|nr:NnrU family protein [Methylophaga sp. OBS4]MCX4186669.1 NnrU family protein [Methylophaga sp. OBS4]
MLILVLGLIVFLGVHSVRIYADNWRTTRITRIGILPWKAIFSLLSLIGLLLIIWGYGEARQSTAVLWTPPLWTRHLAALLMLPAFILLLATYLPPSRIKAMAGHPMLLSVKLWALAHLLANGSFADLWLFGAFLLWAVVDFAVSRRRDRRLGMRRPAGNLQGDIQVIIAGTLAWALFAFYLHGPLFGVKPFI